ncbi:hypothetical protein BU14_0417s0010 [Porphyra umbilicalis]|uniref:Uncharacterized protein n=1 Tax=Porphyra umbilicalis TaxID=2786 RepID=A0A1X6NVP5_PORUM|nr:hypothetical protein BU14_0417s0010 [Porphyra umbilicalis]|eukprot:OSX72635.1 hypothetical protein BU14_0417s0010 [Porphyra umbilicalis]
MRLPCPPAPGPTDAYVSTSRIDDLLRHASTATPHWHLPRRRVGVSDKHAPVSVLERRVRGNIRSFGPAFRLLFFSFPCPLHPSLCVSLLAPVRVASEILFTLFEPTSPSSRARRSCQWPPHANHQPTSFYPFSPSPPWPRTQERPPGSAAAACRPPWWPFALQARLACVRARTASGPTRTPPARAPWSA